MKVKLDEIKEFPNYIIRSDGQVYSVKRNIYLSAGLSHNGYRMVILQHNGTRKTFRVNRLVATCFIPNPENKATVNHLDGNKLNDDVSNLEWATHSENTIHSFETGLQDYKHGEKTNFAKLTWALVDKIRESKRGDEALAKRYGVSKRTISRIRKGETWTKRL